METLHFKAFGSQLILFFIMGLLLFLPAQTVHYWQAWAFLALFAIASIAITLYLVKFDPQLLARRLHAGPAAEHEPAQKLVQLLALVGFAGILIICALDQRLGWSAVGWPVTLTGNLLVALGFLCILFVYKENTFASATIAIHPGQRVISTGPYAQVRHPMYLGALLMFIGMPLSLGSYWGLFGAVLMIPLLIWRLLNEEKFLLKNLPGYAQYRDKVRYRLIPFTW
jgi:protein-S-isoprenylcysteine O-methyltransferase Ste14